LRSRHPFNKQRGESPRHIDSWQDYDVGVVINISANVIFINTSTLTGTNLNPISTLMANLVQTLRAELSALEADLSSDPRYRKIERIRALLAEYEDVGPNSSRYDSEPYAPRRERTRSHDTKAERVRETIREILTKDGDSHRSSFLKVLTERGVMGDEKDPMASLAAYLSDFKEFQSLGGGRWALATPPTNEASPNESKEDALFS
jgi:hypothetical protein